MACCRVETVGFVLTVGWVLVVAAPMMSRTVYGLMLAAAIFGFTMKRETQR